MELYLLGVVGAYLLGSIPFGLVISRIFGADDPRTHGSHNIGFTNVLRVSGKKVGIFTLIGDLGKGTVATGYCRLRRISLALDPCHRLYSHSWSCLFYFFRI